MISRYLAGIGWDWIIIDAQHGCFDNETIYECVHVIRSGGATPIVRVPVGNPGEVERMLDFGAHGVVVPMIRSVTECEAVARAAKYPPVGSRSFGGDNMFHYGDAYPERANAETLLLVQIEHIDAVHAAHDIVALPGVDGVFLGPTDLALSMGLSRSDYERAPAYQEAIREVVRICAGLAKLACVNVYRLEDVERHILLGFDCVTLRSDADLFVESSKRLFEAMDEITTRATLARDT